MCHTFLLRECESGGELGQILQEGAVSWGLVARVRLVVQVDIGLRSRDDSGIFVV